MEPFLAVVTAILLLTCLLYASAFTKIRFLPATIFLVSAAIFGVAHYRGVPFGVPGVFLAGVLGFVLAKSVYETGGFFWAWTIHFVQDVIIITTLFMMHKIEVDGRPTTVG